MPESTYFAFIDVELSTYATIAYTAICLLLVWMILFTKSKFVSDQECRIFINDDEKMTKSTPAGGTLLNSLTSNGIPIPSPCGGKATCKQCRVRVLEGGGEPLATDLSTFSKKDIKEGWRLSCQCKVKNDLKVHIDEHLMGVKEWDAKVISNENVATFIKELVVEVPEEVPYKSGGYLQFHVPPFKTNTGQWRETMQKKYWSDWEKFKLFDKEIDFSTTSLIRAYSMASYPAEGKIVKFNIRIATPPFVAGKIAENIPWGVCSSYTFGLKPGDKVRLSGPYGESFMINDDREIVFLIGGAGSSFGRSHVMHLFRTENTKRKVTFWYGARSLKENIYEQDLRQLEKEFSNFSYRLVLSEPLPEDYEAGWPKNDPEKVNFLFKAFEVGQLKKMEDPEECLYYVCGPPMHNQSVMKLLDQYGVPRESIILDDFGS